MKRFFLKVREGANDAAGFAIQTNRSSLVALESMSVNKFGMIRELTRLANEPECSPLLDVSDRFDSHFEIFYERLL